MFIALTITAVILAAMAGGSAVKKLQKDEQVLTVIGGTVGVPERLFPVLAALELAGAVGVLIGLALVPIGVLAAAGLVAYFVGAFAGHIRAGDIKGLSMPLVPLVLSITRGPQVTGLRRVCRPTGLVVLEELCVDRRPGTVDARVRLGC